MKKISFLLIGLSFAFLAILDGSNCMAAEGKADAPTAFELMKLGDQFLEKPARGHVIQAVSEQSTQGLVPHVWSIVYYDVTAPKRPVRVRFNSGKMVDTSRPLRLFSRLQGQTRPLNQNRLKIDSDKALEIATAQPNLKNIRLRASKMELRWDKSQQPVWQVDLYAEKESDPAKTVHLDFVLISPETGEVLENYLKIDRAR